MQSRTGAKKIRNLLAALGFGIALLVGLLGSGNGAEAGISAGVTTAAQASKIAPIVLQDTANGKSTSVMVVMADQADVDSANSMKDQDARGWYVYNTLTEQARRTQASIRTALDAQGITYTSFWAVNALVVTVDRPLLEALAARNDVGKIESNRPSRWVEDPQVANLSIADASPNAIEWGVNNVNAPQVWAMGYTGQGIVIGDLDTGFRWTQNALKPKYRGWNGTTADHNYNWHDAIHSGGGACGPNSLQPCDDYGHGTHTLGTTVGDDGTGNQIGVAPGARWIGCRNMNVGAGTPATYTECFQWTIAPTDLNNQNPNPALRPHVLNNSWGCPTSEGCAAGTLETIVNNTQAAGIFVEASAGNSGSSCGSVTDPPATYEASFSTGAIDINNTLAGFSSRGPVTVDGSNRLKPNISAPGVNVRSSYYSSDTSYASLSGTSMAGPHVVGVVALLWSARPQLVRDIAATKAILQNTANPNVVVSPVQTCGGIPSSQIPNNSFGYGRVDALAAVNSVAQGTPTPTTTGVPPTATRTRTTTPTVGLPTSTSTAISTATATRTVTLIPPSATGTTPPVTVVNSTATSTNTTVAATGTNTAAIPTATRTGTAQASATAQATATCSPNGGPYDIAIVFSDDAAPGKLINYIQAEPDVATVNTIDARFSTPSLAQLLPYDEVVVFSNTEYANASALGDVIADYQDAGGIVVSTNANWYGSPYGLQGRWMTGGYTMFTYPSPQRNSTDTLGTHNTAHPLMQGVTALTAFFRTEVTLTAGATQVAAWTDGLPLVAYKTTNGHTAVGINAYMGFPEEGWGGNFGTVIVNAARWLKPGVPCGSATPNPTSTAQSASPTAVSGTGTATSVTSVTAVASATSTACTITFSDVPADNAFYSFIRCLACRGIISGYSDGTFRPGNDITRGQIAKIVSNAAGFSDDPGPQVYEDVPMGSPFYDWVNRLSNRGYMGGYECGLVPEEPCIAPNNYPYFRPNASASRGQLSKIVSNAAGLSDVPVDQFYTDVPPGHPFYLWIMRLTALGVMSGYECGGPNEPCDSENRPYFRPFNNVTRGQASKIVANTFLPGCQTPARP